MVDEGFIYNIYIDKFIVIFIHQNSFERIVK